MPRRGDFKFPISVGDVFGRLTVTEVGILVEGRNYIRCRCSCGTHRQIYRSSVTSGATQSCGCLHLEISADVGRSSATHGESTGSGNETPEYRAWRGMNRRCYEETNEHWERYGGRGITVCESWRSSFPNFLAYVGRRPTPSHTIDRFPNQDGNYEPGNVRWASPIEQARNRSTNKLYSHGDRTMCIAEWASVVGLPRKALEARLRGGMDIGVALFKPLRATKATRVAA